MQIIVPRVNNLRTVSACRERQWHSARCVPGSIPGPRVICGQSLLVFYSAPRGFLREFRFSPLIKNQHLI